VVAWPIEDDAPQGLAAFVAGSARSESEMKGELLRTLPRFLVPEVIWTLDTLPVNVNGKVDRRALRGLLEEKRLERSVA
jgi:acyl-CoA synthetase (AMP-forming)/AMP-acid ligase II